MESRADLHVHSKYSNRPSGWLLRRLGAAECYTEPAEVYRICRRRGMSFVTISDHDCIDGALEIAHLPDTFLSAEVTTCFPEDGCKIHCLVAGITEEQFRVIDRLRHNIYEFQQYVVGEDIVYSVAHPLYRVNDRLTVDHVEKLLLLFKRFEAINGARHHRAAGVAHAMLTHLTPEHIAAMRERQEIEPLGPELWRKFLTGGSDDHCGGFIGETYTVTPGAATVEDFLEHLRQGEHQVAGAHGSSIKLGHSLLTIARSYCRTRRAAQGGYADSLGDLLSRLLGEPSRPRGGVWSVLKGVQRILGVHAQPARDWKTVAHIAGHRAKRAGHDAARPLEQSGADEAEATFARTLQLHRRAGRRAWNGVLESLRGGGAARCRDALPAATASVVSAIPYLTALSTQHKDEPLLRALTARFAGARCIGRGASKKLWVTDTFGDVNGVARTIETLGRIARRRRKPLTVMTCRGEAPTADLDLVNFVPLAEFAFPEYPLQILTLPPLIEILDYIERQAFGEIIISTPGPLGLLARLAAQLLHVRASGIYHTDFALFMEHLTGDIQLAQRTREYERWFYGPMETVFVPSRALRDRLCGSGFEARKLRIMPRGVDRLQFHPSKRRAGFWTRYGLDDRFVFLYVGRVSKEKSVEPLLEVFLGLLQQGQHANLAIVGDGPERPALERRYRHARIAFTGLLEGDALATAYASANAFVFPSTTDTFGNVVLEAQASGLPAIVSNQGGPAEIVSRHNSGIIFDAGQPNALMTAMAALSCNRATCSYLRRRAMQNAQEWSWDAVFDEFWNAGDSRAADQRVDPAHCQASTHQQQAGGVEPFPSHRKRVAQQSVDQYTRLQGVTGDDRSQAWCQRSLIDERATLAAAKEYGA